MVFLTLKEGVSKIIPSFFTIKEGSTSLTKPLSCPKREDVTALRCSEPLRFIVGEPSEVCAMLCGLGPPGDSLLRLTVEDFAISSSILLCGQDSPC